MTNRQSSLTFSSNNNNDSRVNNINISSAMNVFNIGEIAMGTALVSTPITAFYAALLGAFFIYLCIQVIGQRRSKKIGLGDGGDKQAIKVIRVQANFSEYVPFALVLMLIAEINQTNAIVLHVVGVALLVARLLHAMGVRKSAGVTWQRFYGTLTTFAVYAVLIVLNLLAMYN